MADGGQTLVVYGCERTGTRVLSGRDDLPPHEYRELTCLGALDPLSVLRAIEEGADGVLAVGCYEGRCHHLTGSQKALRVLSHVGDVLEEAGLDRERVGACLGSPLDEAKIVNELNEFYERLGGDDG